MSRTGNPLTWCSSPAKGPPIEVIEVIEVIEYD
jgi:hypothetical protein